ncbi:MAG: leucine-rich repeat domain-containing protein [Clostridia bacterium]|nr:leucine-rich repeat domain-containing protein [Clostridia bacterium]
MDYRLQYEIKGRPVLEQGRHVIYGEICGSMVHITGVYAEDPENLEEVCIPQMIGGCLVASIQGDFCGNEWEKFRIGTLQIPDSLFSVQFKRMKPRKLLLTQTEAARLRLVNGILLSGDGTVALDAVEEDCKRYVVPEGVRTIASNAFASSRAQEIILPQSLQEIEEYAFMSARVKHLDVPASVKCIGKYAFSRSDLQSVTLPEGLEKIGHHAFAGSDLRSVRFPGSLWSISHSMCYGCRKLRRVELMPGVEDIGDCAFEGCYELQEVILPEGLKWINQRSFRDCRSLEEIRFPEGLKRIDTGAFENCRTLLEVDLPESAHDVSMEAFWNSPVDEFSWNMMPDDSGKDLFTDVFGGEIVQRLETVRIWARQGEGGMVITGVVYDNWRDARDLYIPAQIEGQPVVDMVWEHVQGAGTGTKVETLHLPDCIPLRAIPGEIRYVRLVLEPTDHPALVERDGCILTADGKILLGPADARRMNFTVPQGVEIIAANAFMETGARKVYLPEGVREIGDKAFGYTPLRLITLPSSLRRIGNRAFAWTRLDELTLPEGVRQLGEFAFESSLIRKLHLPDSLREIGTDILLECRQVEDVSLPAGMTRLPEYRSDDAVLNGLLEDMIIAADTDVYTIYATESEDGMRIGYVRPRGGTTLQEVRVPDMVNCRPVVAMDLIEVPDIHIGTLYVPDSITRIDLRWTQIMDEMVLTPSQHPASCIADTFLMSLDCRTLRQQLVRRAEDVVVPEGVAVISDGAFKDCEVMHIALPHGLKFIGNEAFRNTKLREFVAPQNLQEVGHHAFADCKHLWEVQTGASLREIQDHAFENCTGLDSVQMSEGLERIGNSAFFGCSDLHQLCLPRTLTRLGDLALKNTGLEELYIPASLTGMDPMQFGGTRLVFDDAHPYYISQGGAVLSKDGTTLLHWTRGTEAIVPEGVRIISDAAFAHSRDLVRVVLPDGLQEISDYAFLNCRLLGSITIPSGVKSLGDECFKGCRNLTHVELNEGLERLGEKCFESCSLQHLKVPQSVRCIGPDAFRNCRYLTELTLPGHLIRQENGWYLSKESDE